MNKVLIIRSSIFGEESKSLRLAHEFLAHYPHSSTHRAGAHAGVDAPFDCRGLSGDGQTGIRIDTQSHCEKFGRRDVSLSERGYRRAL